MKKRIVILGAGISGIGAARLASLDGCNVLVSDNKAIAGERKKVLNEAGIEFEEGGHSLDRIRSADLVIKSPGIPDFIPPIQEAMNQGVPVLGEIEYAWTFIRDKFIVGITGSNGKTTTTTLTYEILKQGSRPVYMAGNVGNSLAGLLADNWDKGIEEHAVFVLELSSFQLDDTVDFRPNIGVLLNISADHLDRYENSIEKYTASKFGIAKNQSDEDLFLLNGSDAVIRKFFKEKGGHFQSSVDFIYADEYFKLSSAGDPAWQFDLGLSNLRGPHNAFNAACAVRIAKELGMDPEHVKKGLNAYQAPEHRLELVDTVNGVTYINDSKATNIDAVVQALRSMDQPTIWIVGGEDKGNDYSELVELVKEKVKGIVALGVDNRKIKSAFEPLGLPYLEVRSADAAVRKASGLAKPGDTVLLSPACASFDLFKNYMQRGAMFKEAVYSLRARVLN